MQTPTAGSHAGFKASPLATLEVASLKDNAGKTLIATLKCQGRIVAQGQSVVAAQDSARVILYATEFAARRNAEDYELWVVCKNAGEGSWFPGFGDAYIQDTWHFQQGPWKKITDLSAWREKRLSSPENRLRIHYHRYGGYLDGVGLWTWNDHSDKPPVEVFEIARDEFGLVFELDLAEYAAEGRDLRLGLLPRRAGDWHLKEDENKYWDASLGHEIWLIGTVNQIWKERPETSQKVLAAYLDTSHCMIVELSRPVDPGELGKERLAIQDGQGKSVKISHLVHSDKPSNSLRVKTAQRLEAGSNTYSVSVEGFAGAVPAIARGVLDDPQMFCAPLAVLGASYSPASTSFRLFAPTAEAVAVVLYDRPIETGGHGEIHPLVKVEKGIFAGTVAGDLKGRLYRYRLQGRAYPTETEVIDPYCVNRVGEYGRITDLAETNPPGWEQGRIGPKLESPVDMLVYEIHVRDFSVAGNSGIWHKGKYLGFTEAGTYLLDHPAIKTGLDHLQELGITHVQLLPVQSFRRQEDTYNWGYMTVAFNSPESWYASHPDDDSKIREFKQLIAALHARNIGVIMDVVYNHTDHGSPFGLINPGYYYRFYLPGQYANGSGVGNDFRSEAPMARKFIIDSLKYWVEEYGVDGFRFDLMALIDSDTMREAERELRKIKPDIVLYGEPWSSGHSPIKGQPTDKHAIRHAGIGAFNDHFRNALGGNPNGTEPGFLQEGVQRDKLMLGLAGSCEDWADSPAQSVNYMSCHDNLVLYDKLKWFKPNLSETEVLAAMKLGYLLLFTAQGIPLLHGGEEFARTKYGHGNSYEAGDEINRLDWNLKAENFELFTYTRDLIQLRKQHPLFRLRTAESIRERFRPHPAPSEKSLMFSIDGNGLEKEEWAEACVLANGETHALEFALPYGRWLLVFDGGGAVEAGRIAEHRLSLSPRSGAILCRMPETASQAIAEAVT